MTEEAIEIENKAIAKAYKELLKGKENQPVVVAIIDSGVDIYHEDLRDNIFYFIKNLDESSVEASSFYINILSHLQDMSQSLEYISKVCHKHINNNHKKLKFNQVRELKQIDDKLETLFNDTEKAFKSGSFEEIGAIISKKKDVYDLVKEKIHKQVQRTRTEESSPKNTTLYFSVLIETKDLMNATMNLLEEYHDAHDSSVEPATLPEDIEVITEKDQEKEK